MMLLFGCVEVFAMLDGQRETGRLEVFKQAASDLLPAAKEYYEDAKKNLPAFTEHVLSEAASAITFGATIGALLPSKGPAGLLVAGAFSAPMIYDAVTTIKDTYHDANQPGANQEEIAHGLAKKFVAASVDFGVNMAGGYGGTEAGYRVARSETIIGRAAQATQRSVMKVENESLVLGAQTFLTRSAYTGETDAVAASVGGRFSSRVAVNPGAGVATEGIASTGVRSVISTPSVQPEQMGYFSRAVGTLARRADQYEAVRPQAAKGTSDSPAFQTYRATLHGHTKFDDGMGTAEENYAKAIEGKLDIAFLTPHNHDGARQGVGPDDPRAAAEAGVPILAQTPAEYGAIIDAAKAASKPGKFYAGYGVEAGTIGPGGHSHGGDGTVHQHGPGEDGGVAAGANPPEPSGLRKAKLVDDAAPAAKDDHSGDHADDHVHDHDHENPVEATPTGTPFDPLEAARQSHHGGVNHINILGINSSLIVADRQPHGGVVAALSRLVGRGVPIPDVKHYPDGDYLALAQILGKTTDVTGQTPIVQFNHPRFNSNSETDYGVGSFANKAEWLKDFVLPYVKLQEVVKGEALNASPVVETMKPGDFDPTSYAGYIDMGVHAGPTYGRDSHFGDPGGRPAGTGVLATALDEPGVFEALRNRRTFATTNYADLQGVLTANNDAVYMGTALDQAAVPNLNLKFKVGGNIQPDAQYQIKLMADEQIGDGKVAVPAKTINISGADLLKANQEVLFDPIQHRLGNQSGYYIEASRTVAGSTATDRMLTAPIWVEPLSGAQHGLVTRALVGNGSQYLTSPFIPKFLPN